VDKLAADAAHLTGGLIVLGSLHAEMSALGEDRSAPLFHRTTDVLLLDHLDFAARLELLSVHADTDPRRVLFDGTCLKVCLSFTAMPANTANFGTVLLVNLVMGQITRLSASCGLCSVRPSKPTWA
jgi:hypothetical protein